MIFNILTNLFKNLTKKFCYFKLIGLKLYYSYGTKQYKSMKTSNSEQIKLVERVLDIKRIWPENESYTSEYVKEYGKRKSNLDTIRNVWNLKGLSRHLDVIENLEKLAKKYAK